MPKTTVWFAVTVGVFGLLVAAEVAASPQEPSLRVHVTGDVVAGSVMTTVVSPLDDATNRREARISAGAPVATFGALEPGHYDLLFTMPDGRAARAQVTIESGRVVVMTVAVPGDATSLPILTVADRYRSGEGADFGARAIRDLPSADNLWSLVETAAPFVVVDRMDTGGLGTGRAALLGSRGDSWAMTNVSFGGLQVRGPTRTGLLPVLPDMNAAEAVAVNSGLAPVEVDTPGVVINWTPRRPGSSWRGGFDASLATPGMVGENGLPAAPSLGRIEDWRNAAAFAGGPLADRVGLFVSTGFTRATYLEREQSPALTSDTRTVLAHLVANPTASDQVRALGAFEGAQYPFDDRHQFEDPAVSEGAAFGRGQLSWDHFRESGARRSLSIGFQRGAWQPEVPAGASGGTMDRVLDGVVPPPAADTSHTQWDARAEWGAATRRWANTMHEVRSGVTLRHTTVARDIVTLPTVAESVAGLPARVWVPVAGTGGSKRALNELGLYAADRIALGPRLTVDVGVRADLAGGDAGGSESIRWNTVSPRLSFRWSPAALSFFGGVGRYAGGHALSFLAYGDPGEATWDVHRWADPNADGQFDADEVGVLVARAGSGRGVGSLDPDLRVPRTTEWVAGAEVRPTRYSTLRGSIVIRRQTDLVGVTNTGLTDADYRLFYVPDINADEGSPADDQLLPIYERLTSSFGRDALLLTNPAAEAVRHEGIELTYEISSPRWFMLFGATAYRTLGRGGTLGHDVLENDPLVLGDRFWNPNAAKDEAGRLFFDRAYVGKWTTAYRAAGDVRLAAVVRYQDGQPFTRFVVAPDLAGGPEITHAYPVGRTRFTYTATLDVRVEKGFGLGGMRRGFVRLDIFNLTNHANELEEDVLSGPTFRESTVVQPPRTMRFGVRVEF